MTHVVALTGGIASGKTAVSDHLQSLGVPVIDTDVIAREVVEPGQPLLDELCATLGKDILDEHGALDRARLRERIFLNPSDRQTLESILHPGILAEARNRIDRLKKAQEIYCVVVIPLLAENQRHPWIDRILLVDTPEELQRSRLMKRDGSSLSQAESIIEAQATREARIAIADDIIVNDQTLAHLIELTEQQHAAYLELFSNAAPNR